MNEYSKYKDINAVMIKAEKQLGSIKENYNQSLKAENISSEFLIEVKDYLGNLRSALDYLGNKLTPPLKYFPVCNSDNDFNNKTNMLDVNVSNKLRKWQPYNNNDWLKSFNILNNKSKHLTLVPQKRKETTKTEVRSKDGTKGIAWTGGVKSSGGIRVMGVPIDKNTQLPVPNNSVDVKKITLVHFIFDNSISPELPQNISALPFLILVLNKIKELIKDVEQHI